MNIVVLTNNGSLSGKRIIRAIRSRNIPVSVVIIRQPLWYYLRLFHAVARRNGVFETIFLSLNRIVGGIRQRTAAKKLDPECLGAYYSSSQSVAFTRGTNSDRTERILEELNPDLLVLGQTGIVRKNILGLPTIGTLNAHPGILPFYRGIDSWKWAILNGEPEKIGASVHWVDEGVDSGNIISTSPCPIASETDPLTIERQLDSLCATKMVDVIEEIVHGNIPTGQRQSEKAARQYFKMNRRLENDVNIKLRSI